VLVLYGFVIIDLMTTVQPHSCRQAPTEHADDGDAPAALLIQCVCVVAGPLHPLTVLPTLPQSSTPTLSIGALTGPP
jgi:hypothetical protein